MSRGGAVDWMMEIGLGHWRAPIKNDGWRVMSSQCPELVDADQRRIAVLRGVARGGSCGGRPSATGAAPLSAACVDEHGSGWDAAP